MIHYRLGLDVGTNSLGWCTLEVKKDNDGRYQPVSMLDWGVRIFDDGREPAKKDVAGESSEVQRRVARGMRRRYDRLIMRRRNTIKQLVKHGLFPSDKNQQKELESLNPLKLRSDAAQKQLTPYETGRALFHLQQRRGFKSNRKEAQKDGNNELAGMKGAIADLEQKLVSQYTLGQFLYEQNKNRKPIRFRSKLNEKGKAEYNFYPSREMVEREFNEIWKTQKRYNPAIFTEDAHEAIQKAIFSQRSLKPQPKGKCSIIPTDTRIDWALPSAQKFRIIKEVNNLAFTAPYTIRGQKLNKEQRQKLYDTLLNKSHLTFKQIKTSLGSSEYEFNLELPGRDKIEGDRTAKIMRDKSRFGKEWDNLDIVKQDDIVSKIIIDDEKHRDYMDDETLEDWLVKNYPLTPERAKKIINAPLPDGCASFGKTVISTILPKMQDGMLEHEAIKECGWNHSNDNRGEICDILPYYGKLLEKHAVRNEKSSDPMVREFGRIGNPTVHIALNQIRRLMNKLKERYGCWPQEIVIEMARNLKNGTKEISKIVKEIDKNTKQREKWKIEIEQYKGGKVTHNDYVKMKLWTELATDPLQRKCVYTGRTISQSMLFAGNQVQVDHILPYSKTLDNTSANLVLVTAEGNQIKKNRPPYEAFRKQEGEYSYAKVLERSNSLPKSKRWRFFEDAMDIFDSKAKTIVRKSSIDGGEIVIDTGLESFAARQLNDTSYIAKLGKKYLAYACENGERSVMATPGTLTGLLRKSWGLNDLISIDGEKNRNDHRHHAIDALVIALTTRSMVKSVADAAKKEEETGISLVKHIQTPWTDFAWETLQKRLEEIVVSHKPDHGSPAQKCGGTSGRMHKDTYYGYVLSNNSYNLVKIRKPIQELAQDSKGKRVEFKKLVENIAAIIDNHLRQEVIKELNSCLSENRIEELTSIISNYNTWLYNKENLKDETITKERKITKTTLTKFKGYFDFDKFEENLRNFSVQFGSRNTIVRNIRLLERISNDSVVKVKVREKDTPWKLAVGGSNHCAEIYCPKDGNKAGKWQMEVIKTFDANKPDFVPEWRKENPDADFIMSIHRNDIVAYEENGRTEIRKVKKMLSNSLVYLTPINVAKEKADQLSWAASSSQLQLKNAREIKIEIDGGIYDPLGILTTKPKNYGAA